MSINLLYHDVTVAGNEHTSGFPGPGAARYKLTSEEFERHLKKIAAATTEPPIIALPAEEMNFARQDTWMMTFDDGGSSAVTEIANRLERFGWRGWFFIATDFIGTPSFCTRRQIRELHNRGHVIGSHSCSHPERISSCKWEKLVDEWTQSCQVLSEIIEQPIFTGSVPGGFYSRDVARAASKAGIRVLFNSEPTTTSFQVDGTTVLGRYNVYRGMSADDAALLVSSPMRRWRQTTFWNAKKVAKILVGPLYKAVRQRILAKRYADP